MPILLAARTVTRPYTVPAAAVPSLLYISSVEQGDALIRGGRPIRGQLPNAISFVPYAAAHILWPTHEQLELAKVLYATMHHNPSLSDTYRVFDPGVLCVTE